MKQDRPSSHFWLLAMSGTILNDSPKDIAGAMGIIMSPERDDASYKFHNLRPDSLTPQDKIVQKYFENKNDLAAKTASNEAVITSGTLLPDVLICRHDGSLWVGKRLIGLESLIIIISRSMFPTRYHDTCRNWCRCNAAPSSFYLVRDLRRVDKQAYYPSTL